MIGLPILPTTEHPQTDDYASLFINDVPLLDVRAPVEFSQGAFPNAVNLPLMSDSEREAVGTEYKQLGQEAAIALGASLATHQVREKKQKQWAAFFKQNPNAVLYCFRGGLRSKISQQWIYDQTKTAYPRIRGGYKALRRFLIETIDRIPTEMPIVILGGRTGSGKTRLLKQLDNRIDLEGLANHRGSAFGPTATPQPTQINFENALAIQMLKQEAAGADYLLIEDEGSNIGSLGIPQSLYNAMLKAPIVKMEVPQDERNRISVQEYIIDIHQQFKILCASSGDSLDSSQNGESQQGVEQCAIEKLFHHLFSSLKKIQKRLGGLRYQQCKTQMQEALVHYQENKDTIGFVSIINTLLVEYYDPMYDYQIAKKTDRIVFSGSRQEVLQYLENYTVSG